MKNTEKEKKLKIIENEVKLINYFLENYKNYDVDVSFKIKDKTDKNIYFFNITCNNNKYKILKNIKVDRLREKAKYEKLNEKSILVYTDGSCYGGAYGEMGLGIVIIYPNGKEINWSLYGGYGTNNKAELLTVVTALKFLRKGSRVDIYTDSQYVSGGYTSWVYSWIRKGWFNDEDENRIKYIDLWRALWNISKDFNLNICWTKAHVENEFFNSKADELAKKALSKSQELKKRDLKIVFDKRLEKLVHQKIKTEEGEDLC